MKLKDTNSIFDIPTSIIQTYASRYRISVILCLILDGFLAVLSGLYLIHRGNIIELIELAILIAVLINFIIIRSSVNADYNNVLRLYIKYRDRDIHIKSYTLNEKDWYSVLSNFGVLNKSGKTSEVYIEILNSYCIRNMKYAKKVVKLLEPFLDKDGDTKMYVMKGNIYVGMVEEEKKYEFDN